MTELASAGWFSDPFSRYEHRYWDGQQWTEHVGSQGQQMTDAPIVAPPTPPASAHTLTSVGAPVAAQKPVNKKVQRQVQKLSLGNASPAGGGTLFTEQILVVNQRAKMFGKKAEYAVFDQQGRKLGGVREFGTSNTSWVVGRTNSTKRLQIVDTDGNPALTLTRPATAWKSKVLVTRADGSLSGEIVQESLGLMAEFLGGKYNVRFRMEFGGEILGSINAEDWRAWDFNIQDATGTEIGRITKTWAGFRKENFTNADNYVLECTGLSRIRCSHSSFRPRSS